MPEKRGSGAGLPKDPDVKTVGNDPEKRWRGGKGSQMKIEERVKPPAMRTFSKVELDGKSVERTGSSRFGTSFRTGEDDYKRAMELLKTEQIATRSEDY